MPSGQSQFHGRIDQAQSGPLATLLNATSQTIPMDATIYGKLVADADAAVAPIGSGATVMVGGFGGAGFPFALRDALGQKALSSLTVVCNNADFGVLTRNDGLKRLICSYPSGPSSELVKAQIESGNIELYITPQGTLIEQIRAGAAGLGGILTPTGVGTELEERFETVTVNGREYILAPSLRADFALVRAAVADSSGNLSCRRASRNFNPAMAMAATYTIAQVEAVVPVGALDPDLIHIPSPFVDRIVVVPRTHSVGTSQGESL